MSLRPDVILVSPPLERGLTVMNLALGRRLRRMARLFSAEGAWCDLCFRRGCL